MNLKLLIGGKSTIIKIGNYTKCLVKNKIFNNNELNTIF